MTNLTHCMTQPLLIEQGKCQKATWFMCQQYRKCTLHYNGLDLRPFKSNKRILQVPDNYTFRKSWARRSHFIKLSWLHLIFSLSPSSGAGSSQMLIYSFAFLLEKTDQFYSPMSSFYNSSFSNVGFSKRAEETSASTHHRSQNGPLEAITASCAPKVRLLANSPWEGNKLLHFFCMGEFFLKKGRTQDIA